MREYPLSTIHAAMALADEAEACGEATLLLNGYIFTLTELDDFQLLVIIMQHRSSAAKVLELLDNLTEAVEMAKVAA